MRKELLDGDRVFVIRDFLTPGECERYVRLTEDVGYGVAPITTAIGPVLNTSVRNNERVMLDRPEWAAELWARAEPFLPSPLGGWAAVGLNERFRFYRYHPGQTFRPHTDGHFIRGDEWSKLTFMIYLNGACEGGETVIYFQDGDSDEHPDGTAVRVKPEAGKALVFTHALLHEGAPVTAGRKYVMRTDVMYRVPPRFGTAAGS